MVPGRAMLRYRMRISLANVVSRTHIAFQNMKDVTRPSVAEEHRQDRLQHSCFGRELWSGA